MMHPQFRTPTSPSIWKVAGNIFKSAAAVVCCSGIAELIAQLIGSKCLMTCLVSMALGWASQLVASGARTVGISSAPATTSMEVTAVTDNHEHINPRIAVRLSVEGIESVRIYATAYPVSMWHA